MLPIPSNHAMKQTPTKHALLHGTVQRESVVPPIRQQIHTCPPQVMLLLLSVKDGGAADTVHAMRGMLVC